MYRWTNGLFDGGGKACERHAWRRRVAVCVVCNDKFAMLLFALWQAVVWACYYQTKHYSSASSTALLSPGCTAVAELAIVQGQHSLGFANFILKEYKTNPGVPFGLCINNFSSSSLFFWSWPHHRASSTMTSRQSPGKVTLGMMKGIVSDQLDFIICFKILHEWLIIVDAYLLLIDFLQSMSTYYLINYYNSRLLIGSQEISFDFPC